MIDENWVIALAAVGVGLVVGAVAGAVVRRTLSRESRREAVREVAAPASIFVFWLATSTGVVAAMAATNPETLEPIPSEILRWLPNVLAAGLILLVGYAVSVVASGSLGRGFTQATGRRSRLAERTLRGAVMVGAVILALGQLGVETTILIVLIAGTVAGVALAAGLLAGLGGRDVAASIAAGRVLRGEITEGQHVLVDGEPLQVVRLGAASVTLQSLTGDRRTTMTYTRLLDECVVMPNPPPEAPPS